MFVSSMLNVDELLSEFRDNGTNISDIRDLPKLFAKCWAKLLKFSKPDKIIQYTVNCFIRVHNHSRTSGATWEGPFPAVSAGLFFLQNMGALQQDQMKSLSLFFQITVYKVFCANVSVVWIWSFWGCLFSPKIISQQKTLYHHNRIFSPRNEFHSYMIPKRSEMISLTSPYLELPPTTIPEHTLCDRQTRLTQ